MTALQTLLDNIGQLESELRQFCNGHELLRQKIVARHASPPTAARHSKRVFFPFGRSPKRKKHPLESEAWPQATPKLF